ncbi:MAG: ABC transporter permease [Gemmatimonadaceae bacterium]
MTRIRTTLGDFIGRIRAFVSGPRFDREHQDEVRFHIEMEAEKLQRAGISQNEARRRARLAFGSVEGTREEARDARGVRWLDDLRSDVPYALRQLRRTPAFTAVAITTLALGIGANAALFSVVDGVLLRPIPFAESDRLAMVWETDRKSKTTREPASWPDIVDIQRETRTLDATAALAGIEANYAPERGDPERVVTMAITNGFFRLTGVTPLSGRAFLPDDERPGAPLVVILSEQFWRTRLQGARDIVGSTIRIDEELRTVVGIIPDGSDFGLAQIHARAAYHGPYAGGSGVGIWIPLQASEATFPRDTHPFFLLGRIADGSSFDAASSELTSIAAQLEQKYRSNTDRGVFIEPLREVVFAPVRPVLVMLLSAVGLVLLVSCVNVANLLLARSTVRLREVAVRGALGAGWGRLARQFATESFLLSFVGAACGLLLAGVALKVLVAIAPPGIPRLHDVHINARVLGLTTAIAILVGMTFGMVPAMQARRVDVAESFKGDGRGATSGIARKRGREILVVAELALSVTLVLCAALLLRSVGAATAVDPGFRVAGVLKSEYQLPERRYPRNYKLFPAWREIHQFNATVLTRIRAIPGVESAAIASAHPLDASFTNSFTIVGRESESRDWPEISTRLVSPGYFQTMGVKIRRGRSIEDGDDAVAPRVALINDEAARRFFAGRDPIGAEIRFWGMKHRIVGVVDNERFRGVTEPAAPAVYASMGQAPSNSEVLLVRTTGNPMARAQDVRAAIRAVDPLLAVYGTEPLVDTLRSTLGERRFAMVVLGSFALLTLLLALIGIHGVLRYATTQRTREIGIRLALGATQRGAAALVLRGGLMLAAIGTTLGLLGAAVGSRLLDTLLFGVTRSDPVTYLGVSILALVAAALAVALPARSASRIAPVEALRGE